MLTDKDKKQILTNFLETIERISDKKYQQRVWIEGKGPECYSFDEAICDVLEDGDAILSHYKDFDITDSQSKALKKFRDSFDVFSDDNDFPKEFIDSPEWAKIMEMAKEVLKVFDYQKKSHG